MLLGLTEPTEGTARVLGFDPAHEALQVKRRVGYLPDSRGLLRRPDRAAEPALHRAAQRAARGERRGPDRARRSMRSSLSDRDRHAVRDVLAGHAPAARHRRRAHQGSRDPDPRRADHRHRPDRRGRDPEPPPRPGGRARRDRPPVAATCWSRSSRSATGSGSSPRAGLIGLGTVPELATQFGADRSGGSRSASRGTTSGATDRIALDPGGHPARSTDGGARRDSRRRVGPHRSPADAGRQVREAVLAAAARTVLGLTAIRSVQSSLDEIYRNALHCRGPAPHRPCTGALQAPVDESRAQPRHRPARLDGRRRQGVRRPACSASASSSCS